MDVREVRKCYGLTQRQLAEVLGVAQSTVASWERDHRVPQGVGVLAILNKMEEYRSFPCEVIPGSLRRPPVEFPLERWTPIVRQDAVVRLPVALHWSPIQLKEFDLANSWHREFVYKQVLECGAVRDICFWIDPDLLLECYEEIHIATYAKEGFLRFIERLKESVTVCAISAGIFAGHGDPLKRTLGC